MKAADAKAAKRGGFQVVRAETFFAIRYPVSRAEYRRARQRERLNESLNRAAWKFIQNYRGSAA